MTITITLAALVSIIIVIVIAHRHITTLKIQYAARIESLQQEFEKQQASFSTASRRTIKGHLAELVYPILKDCEFLPSDMRFIGDPIDYIVFNGYTDTKDGDGDIIEIVLIDVKQGNAKLSKHQRKIRNAVEEGRLRLRWKTIHIDQSFNIQEKL